MSKERLGPRILRGIRKHFAEIEREKQAMLNLKAGSSDEIPDKFDQTTPDSQDKENQTEDTPENLYVKSFITPAYLLMRVVDRRAQFGLPTSLNDIQDMALGFEGLERLGRKRLLYLIGQPNEPALRVIGLEREKRFWKRGSEEGLFPQELAAFGHTRVTSIEAELKILTADGNPLATNNQ